MRRLLTVIPTLVGVSIVVFVLLRVVPGDPIAMMIPPGASQADIDHLRALYGLDQPILNQFTLWLGQALRGDLGTSISLRQDVVTLVLGRLPATLELAGLAMLMAVGLGVGLAVGATYLADRGPDWLIEALVGLLLAIPDFLWALIFVLATVALGLNFPITGRINPRLDIDFATQFYLLEALVRLDAGLVRELLRHMVLPSLALALPLAGTIARVLRSSLAEVMERDFIRMARVKGFSRSRIIVREALRNAAVPTVALTAVQFTLLVGGTVLIERIFGYQGIGNMAIDAVINRDLPLIQGLILTFAVLFIGINLAADGLYAALNPRMRGG